MGRLRSLAISGLRRDMRPILSNDGGLGKTFKGGILNVSNSPDLIFGSRHCGNVNKQSCMCSMFTGSNQTWKIGSVHSRHTCARKTISVAAHPRTSETPKK